MEFAEQWPARYIRLVCLSFEHRDLVSLLPLSCRVFLALQPGFKYASNGLARGDKSVLKFHFKRLELSASNKSIGEKL